MELPAHDQRLPRGAVVSSSIVSTSKRGRLIPLSVFLLALMGYAQGGEPVYPLKVSENRRYFIDQKGDPVFWLGTTQWQLFREYTLEDARTIIEKTKGHGFAFAQVMLLGVGDGGGHLVTFKPDPAPHPMGFAHEESWLDFSCMQTWKWVEQIYPMVTQEYQLQPVEPVVMAEGGYEHGSEYGFDNGETWSRTKPCSPVAGGPMDRS